MVDHLEDKVATVTLRSGHCVCKGRGWVTRKRNDGSIDCDCKKHNIDYWKWLKWGMPKTIEDYKKKEFYEKT